MNSQQQDLVVAGRPMALRPLSAGEAPALIALHNQVFGSSVDGAWFDWKYGAGTGGGLGMGLWHDGQMIAFCGGVPRQFCLGSQLQMGTAYLQIGDVMVRPDWRAVLTRRGVFYTVSQAFYDAQIGANAAYAAGFGFPSVRHLKLAEKLGLLRGVGQMTELLWNVQWSVSKATVHTPKHTSPAVRNPWFWRLQALQADQSSFDQEASACWAAMRGSLPKALLGERSPNYLRWRFASRPHRRCVFWALKRPWSSRPLGLAVLSEPVAGQSCRWLDWVGPAQALPLAAQLVWRQVQGTGASQMSVWASAQVATLLAPHAHRQQAASPIGAPTHSLLPEHSGHAPAWWFMAGDTDFL